MPEELTACDGRIAWQAQYKTWGNTVLESWAGVGDDQAMLFTMPPELKWHDYVDRGGNEENISILQKGLALLRT